MHLTVMNCTACRPVKELRTVEDIMLREQELAEQAAGEAERVQKAKAEADAILMAVNNRPASSSAQTDELIVPFNTADSMEVCSTAELVELFAEYTEADEQQKQNDFFVSELGTETDIDFNHPALTEIATASAPLAHAVLGDSHEEYNLDDLVSKD